MLATQRWKTMIEVEHAQSDRLRAAVGPTDDHWQPYAHQFKADPRRTDDSLVNRLLEEVTPELTVLDVGAGGGRLALPLALRCRHLTAVEPSASMCAVFRQQAADFSIRNVTLSETSWDEAEVGVADVALCAHVVYVVPDIAPFLRKLEAHARQRVLMLLHKEPPQALLYPLWERIHGEKRLRLPGLPEFEEVLTELGIEAHVDLLRSQPFMGFDDYQQALEQLGRRLYLAPGSRQMAAFESMLPDLLEEVDGRFVIAGNGPREVGLVRWQPKGASR